MTRSKARRLTAREAEVLHWICQGWASRQVAQKLYISKKTVDYHLGNVYEKLGVSCRTQAFVQAARLGLLPADRNP